MSRSKILINFDEDFIKTFDTDSGEGHFLEVDDQYLKKIHDLHNDLPFFPEMKIEKVEKLVGNLQDKTECYTFNKFKVGIKS